jgi:hypothetical protein
MKMLSFVAVWLYSIRVVSMGTYLVVAHALHSSTSVQKVPVFFIAF